MSTDNIRNQAQYDMNENSNQINSEIARRIKVLLISEYSENDKYYPAYPAFESLKRIIRKKLNNVDNSGKLRDSIISIFDTVTVKLVDMGEGNFEIAIDAYTAYSTWDAFRHDEITSSTHNVYYETGKTHKNMDEINPNDNRVLYIPYINEFNVQRIQHFLKLFQGELGYGECGVTFEPIVGQKTRQILMQKKH